MFTQVISSLIIIFINSKVGYSWLIAAFAQGVLAAIIGKLLRLKNWWIVINLIFAPAIISFSTFHVPRWSFLVGFVILLLVNWNSLKDQVPLYLTGDKTQKLLEEILRKQKNEFSFIDLGSGLAGTLYYLSKQFPHAQFYGAETAPLVFITSWFRCFFRTNCHIRFRSIWNEDLSKYDFVYCFLSPVPMPEIGLKAKVEMKKGSLLISNTFEIPGITPSEVYELNDWRDSRLLVWVQ